MLNYNLNINSPLQQEKKNEDVRPQIYWDYSYTTNINRFPAVPPFVSSSYATMSISANGTNCIGITSTNNGNFTTNGQAPITASLTGSNWPSTGSVTMSFTVAGITYDPLAVNQFYSSSFSASSTVYNSNPSITGSILTSSFLASEFYRFYVSASLINNYAVTIPTGGLIQRLDASKLASYPGSGSVWYDISGYNHNMSASFGATFPSFSNNQFIFNATSSAVSTFITSSISAYSMIVWTKLGTLEQPEFSGSAGGAYSFTSGSGFTHEWDSLCFDENGEDKWEIATGNGIRDVFSSVVETNVNDYLMISMTNAGLTGSQKLYRNDNLVGSGSKGSEFTTNKNLVLVGNRYYKFPTPIESGSYASTGFYSGSICSALFYNKVLSQAEISTIFAAGAFAQ